MPHLRAATLLTLLLLLAGPVHAQHATDRDAPPAEQRLGTAGERALLFGFNMLSLGSVDGGIGYKKWRSDDTALILSLDARTYGRNESSDEHDNTDSYGNVQLTGSQYRYVAPERSFSPYWMWGGRLDFDRRSHKHASDQHGETGWSESILTLQAIAGFGVEYRFLDRFALSGHNEIGLGYGLGKKAFENADRPDDDIRRWNLDLYTVGLRLAVYL